LVNDVIFHSQADSVLSALRDESQRSSTASESKELGVGHLSAYQPTFSCEKDSNKMNIAYHRPHVRRKRTRELGYLALYDHQSLGKHLS
jgi:hypothetical protein